MVVVSLGFLKHQRCHEVSEKNPRIGLSEKCEKTKKPQPPRIFMQIVMDDKNYPQASQDSNQAIDQNSLSN